MTCTSTSRTGGFVSVSQCDLLCRGVSVSQTSSATPGLLLERDSPVRGLSRANVFYRTSSSRAEVLTVSETFAEYGVGVKVDAGRDMSIGLTSLTPLSVVSNVV